ncbi:hypothetical protein ACFZBU_17960 [Embleya sp. NPDC008237]|uniref:hypothetical protein n=1 Tax=Embleya sp. NPDC008237 TaxID=3363978 RepID=UPI0036E12BDF
MRTGGWGRDEVDEWGATFTGAVALGEFGWAHRLMDQLSGDRDDRVGWVLGRAMLFARQREYAACLDVVRGWLDAAPADDPFRSLMAHKYADYAAVGFLAGEFSLAGTSALLRTAEAVADEAEHPFCPVTLVLDVLEGRSAEAYSRVRRHRRRSRLGDRRARASADALMAVCLAELGDVAGAGRTIRRAMRIAPGLDLIPMAQSRVAMVASGVVGPP